MAQTAGITNTDQLLRHLDHAKSAGKESVTFRVGKYTGNGPAVIGALRRRGYRVERLHSGAYELSQVNK